MAQTTKAITATSFVEMRTTDDGGKFLVLLVTYADASQAKVVFPIETAVPV